MKKRAFSISAVFAVALLTLLSLGSFALAEGETQPTDDGTEMIPIANQKKMLVVYFSATDNTKRVAKVTADAIGADLFEIEPVEAYTKADLDYMNPSSRSSREHADYSIIPAIKKDVPNWDSYTAVLIGYPIWWGEAPSIVRGFVKNHNFLGKAVVPFCTSHSTGMGRSGVLLSQQCRWKYWLHGDCFASTIDDESVRLWAKGLLNGDGPRG